MLLPTSSSRSSIGLPYGWLAILCAWRSSGVTTFHIFDPMGDLGASSTPVVQRFRAGSYETCNLTTYRKHREAVFNLLILVGLCSLTTLTDIQLISPYHPSPALNGGGFSEGFACHRLNPIRYIIAGLRTNYTARSKHARIGTGRNIPGIQSLIA